MCAVFRTAVCPEPVFVTLTFVTWSLRKGARKSKGIRLDGFLEMGFRALYLCRLGPSSILINGGAIVICSGAWPFGQLAQPHSLTSGGANEV